MRRWKLLVPVILALIVCLPLLAGCGSSTSTTPATTPNTTPSTSSPSGGASVKIIDFAFQPASITVKVGEEITWTNSGQVAHTVTADSGGFDSGQLQPGAQYKHAFSAAGTYAYHCANHPTAMLGTVIVTESGSQGATTTPSTPSSTGTTNPY